MPRSAARLRLENVRYVDIDLNGAHAELHLAWRITGTEQATLRFMELFISDNGAADMRFARS